MCKPDGNGPRAARRGRPGRLRGRRPGRHLLTLARLRRQAGERARGLADVSAHAADGYGVGRGRTLARALALRVCGGFGTWEAMSIGLLDPAMPLRGVVTDYASKRRTLKAQAALNPPGALATTEDKEVFDRVAAGHGLPVPRLVAVVGGVPPTPGDISRWATILDADPAAGFVVKPAAGFHGRDVLVVRRASGRLVAVGRDGSWDAPGLVREIAARGGRQIVQERLTDHPGVTAINPTVAVQTVRITTLRSGDEVAILYAFLRMAAPDAVTDNFAHNTAGTMVAVLDTSDGRIRAAFAPRPDGMGTRRVSRHPRTDEPLLGRAVPCWDEVLTVTARAARALAPLATVGWDVAVTAAGPVVVEGNARWDPAPFPGAGASLRSLRLAKPRPAP